MIQTARANLEAKSRQIEQELNDARSKHDQEIEAAIADRTDLRIAHAAVAARLRDAGRATAALAGQACAATATAHVRQTAADAARMLAELREQSDERAGILAKSLDDSYFAGSACERRYDEAREKLKAH